MEEIITYTAQNVIQEKNQNNIISFSPSISAFYLDSEGNNIRDFEYNEKISLSFLSGESYTFAKKMSHTYNPISTINSPSPQHFNCWVSSPKIGSAVKEGWFFQDGLQNNRRIIQKKVSLRLYLRNLLFYFMSEKIH